MTPNFLHNKICTFKILLSWRSHEKKNSVLDDFLSAPKPPPLKKRKFYFYLSSRHLQAFLSFSDSSVGVAEQPCFWQIVLLPPAKNRVKNIPSLRLVVDLVFVFLLQWAFWWIFFEDLFGLFFLGKPS